MSSVAKFSGTGWTAECLNMVPIAGVDNPYAPDILIDPVKEKCNDILDYFGGVHTASKFNVDNMTFDINTISTSVTSLWLTPCDGRVKIAGAGTQALLVGSTNGQDAGIYLDAQNGDWGGSDYVIIRQNAASKALDLYSYGGDINLLPLNSVNIISGNLDIAGVEVISSSRAGFFTDLTSDNININGQVISATSGELIFSSAGSYINCADTVKVYNAGGGLYLGNVSGTQSTIYSYASGSYQNLRLGGNVVNTGIYIDRANDRVGIWDDTPSYTLDIAGSARARGILYVDTTTTPIIKLQENSADRLAFCYYASANYGEIYNYVGTYSPFQAYDSGLLKIRSGNGCDIQFVPEGNVNLVTGDLELSGVRRIATSGGFYDSNGVQILGVQQAAVANVSGGSQIDANCRATLNVLLSRLRSHGIIAT